MFVSYNKNNVLTGYSNEYFEITGNKTKELNISQEECLSSLGKRIKQKKNIKDLKIALICNWNDACGISTYSQFLVKHLIPKVKEIKIFSEICLSQTKEDEDYVVRCWKRGETLIPAMKKIKEYKPDFVIIQHEFGIFPKATHFLKLLEELENFDYLVTLHSVYKHLDKTICTSAIKNIVVHSQPGVDCLKRGENNNNIFFIPHGCIQFEETAPLWNIFQVPYTLCQFGFGFFYKGVDRAIDAVAYLKNNDPKFKDIFYVYLCSESSHFDSVHSEYSCFLTKKIKDMGIEENFLIIRGYNSQGTINNYLRCCKIAVFPYINNPDHIVYGASGAIRIALANKVPVIASESNMFDDLEGVVPRPDSAISLAKEIDEIFSNDEYKNNIINRINKFTESHTWDDSANKYLNIYKII